MLKGKTAFITGGSSGIGKEMVLLFAKQGANIIFTKGRDEEKVQSIIQDASSYHGNDISCIKADFSKKNEVESAALKALEMNKHIDILINNAGIVTSALVLNEKVENIERLMQVNVYAPFHFIKTFCPKMVENKWGRVINISSVSGLCFEQAALAYGMSKSALFALSKTLATELGSSGITVNTIVPGVVDTPMLIPGLEMFAKSYGMSRDKALEVFLAKSKTKNLIDPKDVAAYALFLSSNEAKSITGSEQVIDGGHLL